MEGNVLMNILNLFLGTFYLIFALVGGAILMLLAVMIPLGTIIHTIMMLIHHFNTKSAYLDSPYGFTVVSLKQYKWILREMERGRYRDLVSRGIEGLERDRHDIGKDYFKENPKTEYSIYYTAKDINEFTILVERTVDSRNQVFCNSMFGYVLLRYCIAKEFFKKMFRRVKLS